MVYQFVGYLRPSDGLCYNAQTISNWFIEHNEFTILLRPMLGWFCSRGVLSDIVKKQSSEWWWSVSWHGMETISFWMWRKHDFKRNGVSQTLFPIMGEEAKVVANRLDWRYNSKAASRKDRIGFTSGGRLGLSVFTARCCISSMSVCWIAMNTQKNLNNVT